MASSNQATASSTSTTSANNRLMPSLSNAGDIAVWLHNKLSSDDIWSDKSSIISQLNADILRMIKTCFTELQLNVKLKLLLSFLHLAKRNLDDWKDELEDLIRIAIDDSDLWVSVIGELLLNYPREGIINLDPTSPSFADLSNELKKLVKKQDQKILPLESLFLNRNAFQSQFGQPSQPVRHFQLKRKAKSAALRAELLQKAMDLSSGKRPSTGTTVPIRCRGLNSSDSAPLKGIPSRNHFTSYSGLSSAFGKSTLSRLSSTTTATPGGSFANSRSARLASVAASSLGGSGMKRDGGIVLLDINEAPSAANQRDLKRQRKQEKQISSTVATNATPTTTNTSIITTTATSSTTTSKTLSSSSTTATTIDSHQFEQESSNNNKENFGSSFSKMTLPNNQILSVQQNKNNSVEIGNQNDNVEQVPTTQQKNPATRFNNNKQINNLMENSSNSNLDPVRQQNVSISNQPRQILASKSTPDYAAGLSVLPSSSTTSPSNASIMNRSNLIQQPQQKQTSMYHQHQIQQQSSSSPLKPQTTASPQSPSMYHSLNSSSSTPNSSSSSTINSNQFNQPQQIQNIRSTPSSSNFTMLNQSLQAQQQQQKSQLVANQFTTNFQQSQQNRNINYGYPTQQNQTSQQLTGQYSMNPQNQQLTTLQQQTPVQNFTNNRTAQVQSQQQQQSFQAPFGMYGGSATTAPNNQQQQQTQQSRLSIQQPQPRTTTQSVDQLLRDIMTKFPQLNEIDKRTIINFLNGGANPQPELGPHRNIRLGETIELRKRSADGQPFRVLVETQLLMDYEKKICKKVENVKSLADFSAIRTIGSVGSTTPAPNQQQSSPINIQIHQNSGTTMGPRVALAMHQTAIPIVASNIQQMMTARPGVTFMTMTPSGQLRPINPSMLQQQQQQQQQQQIQQVVQQQQPGPTNQVTANQQQMQYSHLQQRV